MPWGLVVIGMAFTVIHYLTYRLWLRNWIGNRYIRYAVIAILVVNLLIALCFPYIRRNADLPESLYVVLAMPVGISFVLLLTLLLLLIMHAGFWVYTRCVEWRKKAKHVDTQQTRSLHESPFPKSMPVMTRRKSFSKIAALSGALFFVSYSSASVVIAQLRPKIVRLTLPLGLGLCVPWRIVQLSDLHIGGLINKDYVRWVVGETNALKPDIIVLTGDILDAPLYKIMDGVRELANLNARLGKFFVLGNHEYFYNVEDSLQALRNIGIQPLLNDLVNIESTLQIVGVNDIHGYRADVYKPDIHAAYAHARKDLPTILLMHQPKFSADVLQSLHRADLILCGHTHGGQIMPFSLFVLANQGYLSGLYRLNDKTQMYVSSGTGYWGPPMRLGTRTEITVFEVC